jgi:hypothetical protein
MSFVRPDPGIRVTPEFVGSRVTDLVLNDLVVERQRLISQL